MLFQPELEAMPAEPAGDEECRALAGRLAQHLLEWLRLRVQVDVGPPRSIPRQEPGKAKRVFERTDHTDPLPIPTAS